MPSILFQRIISDIDTEEIYPLPQFKKDGNWVIHSDVDALPSTCPLASGISDDMSKINVATYKQGMSLDSINSTLSKLIDDAKEGDNN